MILKGSHVYRYSETLCPDAEGIAPNTAPDNSPWNLEFYHWNFTGNR